jgi:hypothetical protein
VTTSHSSQDVLTYIDHIYSSLCICSTYLALCMIYIILCDIIKMCIRKFIAQFMILKVDIMSQKDLTTCSSIKIAIYSSLCICSTYLALCMIYIILCDIIKMCIRKFIAQFMILKVDIMSQKDLTTCSSLKSTHIQTSNRSYQTLYCHERLHNNFIISTKSSVFSLK